MVRVKDKARLSLDTMAQGVMRTKAKANNGEDEPDAGHILNIFGPRLARK